MSWSAWLLRSLRQTWRTQSSGLQQRAPKLSPGLIPGLLAAYRAGATIVFLAKRYDIHPATVCRYLRSAGMRRWPLLHCRKRSRGRQRKYSAAVDHAIIAARMSGLRYSEISQQTQVPVSTIWFVLRRHGYINLRGSVPRGTPTSTMAKYSTSKATP